MIYAARYVIPVATPHIEYGAVLVREGAIVEIGDLSHLTAAHPEEQVRDFGLAAIMPGFVDVHTHLEYTAMRGLVDDVPYSRWKLQVMDREKLLSAEDWDDAALLGALEGLRAGITTIADISHTGASGRAAVAAGMRGTIYREVATMDRTRVDEVMREAAEQIDALCTEVDSELIRCGIAPHSPYSCHPELFKRVAEYASDGTPVSMHLAGSKEEYDFVKYGSSMLAVDYRESFGEQQPAWLPTGVSPVRYVAQWALLDVPEILAVHCTQVDDSDIELLAARGVAVAYCPRCNSKLGMGMAPLRKFLDAGMTVGIGTDSPASNNVMDMFDEMRVGLLLQRSLLGEEHWLPARQLVKMGTLDGARALGIDDKVGSLEPGKAADLIAIDLSHSHQVPTHYPYSTVVHTATQENVLMTMVGGRILYDEGTWATLDPERIYARAEEMRLKLRE